MRGRLISRGSLLSLLPLVLAMAAVQVARADGEVGLVVEKDGQTQTFCVAYEGEEISGADLLQAAGLSIEALRTGAGSVLCAIDDVGCFNPSSFNSCFCECAGGGGCTYWAFFTRDYGGSWVYSTRAFDRTMASDGDLHGWRWGQGSLSSAPAPDASLTFEAICGHAPGGGTPPAVSAAPSNSTAQPTEPGPATAVATGTVDQPFTPLPSASEPSAAVSVTFTPENAGTATASSQPLAGADDDGDGGAPRGLVAFAGVAATLLILAGAGALWRRRRGA